MINFFIKLCVSLLLLSSASLASQGMSIVKNPPTAISGYVVDGGDECQGNGL